MYDIDAAASTPNTFLNNGICVSKCPKNKQVLECDKSIANCNLDAEKVYPTKQFINYCLPDMKELNETHPEQYNDIKGATDKLKEEFTQMLTDELGSSFFKDIYLSSRAISWSCGLSFVWCIIFLYLMSFFAECIAWVIVGLVQIGFFVASGLTLFQWNTLKSSGGDED